MNKSFSRGTAKQFMAAIENKLAELKDDNFKESFNPDQSMESNKLDILFDIGEKYSATSYKPGSKAYDKELQNEISDICNALNVKPQEAKQLMIDHLGFTKDMFSSSRPYIKSDYNESKSIKEESSKTSFKELKNKVEEISKLTGLTMHVFKPQKEGDTVELFCDEVFDIEGSGLVDGIEYDEHGYDLDTEGILEYLIDIGLYEPDEKDDFIYESKSNKSFLKSISKNEGLTLKESSSPDQYVINMAHDDYESGHPVEDFKEFAKILRDDGIEATDNLWNIYLDNCCSEDEIIEESIKLYDSWEEAIIDVLDRQGYNIKTKTVRNYAEAAAQLLSYSGEAPNYASALDWYNETAVNYPENLEELPKKGNIKESLNNKKKSSKLNESISKPYGIKSSDDDITGLKNLIF